MSNPLPWKIWMPDDLAPPSSPVFESLSYPDEPSDEPEEDSEPDLQQTLAIMQAQAREQGHQDGYADGHVTGLEEGRKAGFQQGIEQGLAEAKLQQAPVHARMQQLVSEFQYTLDALDSVIASRLMQMALEAARQVIGHTQGIDNSALIKQIQALLQQEPCSAASRSCAFTLMIYSALKICWGLR